MVRLSGFPQAVRNEKEKFDGYDGELYAIYILQDYQGRGIGRKLVEPVVDELVRNGINSMLVWVLEGNGAKHFYEKLGGEKIDTADITIGGAELKETAYGWQDLSRLQKEV